MAFFSRFTIAFCCALVLGHMPPCRAGIHELAIKNDSRSVIVIEAFGFTEKGRLEINISEASWKSYGDEGPDLSLIGFFLATEEGSMDVMDQQQDGDASGGTCSLQSQYVNKLFAFSDLSHARQYNHSFLAPSADLYILMFASCVPKITEVSMVLSTSMYNVGGDGEKSYLSDGETQLPAMFLCLCVVYAVVGVLWVCVCMRHRRSTHTTHILMGVLLLSKALYMLSEAEDKAYIGRTGSPHGWDIAFYAFNMVRGVMLFTVIVLIGAGWSFLKPYLQSRDKKILMLVIPLQVLENMAAVVIGETGPFWKEWITWIQIFLLVDVICCAAVLFPIVWSIKNLREEAHTHDKAATNLFKLTLFRQYYIVVMSYLYYTRVVVFALIIAGSYRHRWIGELNREMATLAFYLFTLYKFRPAPHNPYFVLDDDDFDDDEDGVPQAFKADDFEF